MELTEDQKKFIMDMEEEFSNRFTKSDTVYWDEHTSPLPTPPIIVPWYTKQRRRFDFSRGRGRGRDNFNGRGRDRDQSSYSRYDRRDDRMDDRRGDRRDDRRDDRRSDRRDDRRDEHRENGDYGRHGGWSSQERDRNFRGQRDNNRDRDSYSHNRHSF